MHGSGVGDIHDGLRSSSPHVVLDVRSILVLVCPVNVGSHERRRASPTHRGTTPHPPNTAELGMLRKRRGAAVRLGQLS